MKLSDPYNVAEFRNRSIVVGIIFSSLIGILILRLWYLQIWQGEQWRQFSDHNRFKIERLSAPRGQILDRNGNLLADNRPRFDFTYTRGYAQDLEAEMALVGQILGWNATELSEKMEKIRRSPKYQAVLVAEDLTQNQLALFELKSMELPGSDIGISSVRDFLFKDLFFHVIGYTGEFNEADLKLAKERFPEREYKLGDQRGIIGLESLHEGILRGRDGQNFSVVDVKGRRVNAAQWELLPQQTKSDPIAGKNIVLSLDLNLQMEAVKAFGNQAGAAVAFDPRNGEVLAYVSRPALDPNVFTKVISSESYKRMMSDPENPFLDRVVGEHYPPGSTLKLAMALGALENGAVDTNTTFYCGGSYRLGRRVWGCHKRDGHGRVEVVQAIAQSCDVYFYNAATAMGLDAMFSWATRLGLGRRTYLGSEALETGQERIFRFNTEQPGFIPYEDWIHRRRHTTVEAETINSGIGQGAFLVTMMQLARMTAAFGNGGKIFEPLMVKSVSSFLNGIEKEFQSRLENRIEFSPYAIKAVQKGMEEVVFGALGTARAQRMPHIRMGGKTGTAQVVNLELWKKMSKGVKEYEDHALFVALAPLQDPKIAVAVIVEHGGHGGSAAAPIARKMVEAYLGPAKAEVSNGIRN